MVTTSKTRNGCKTKEERIAALERLKEDLNLSLNEYCVGKHCQKVRDTYKALSGIDKAIINIKREGKKLKGGLD